MSRQHIFIEEIIEAPVEDVFERFADHEWFTGLFGGPCKRVWDGEGDVNGLGSVRRMGAGPAAFEETIVKFEPNKAIYYQITKGSPLKNHLGKILFCESNGKTFINYQIEFEGKFPLIGPVVKRALEAAWKQNSKKQLSRI